MTDSKCQCCCSLVVHAPPFPAPIEDQHMYPQRGWELDSIAQDSIAIALLDALDVWRRCQDSDTLREMLDRAREELDEYSGIPRKRRAEGEGDAGR